MLWLQLTRLDSVATIAANCSFPSPGLAFEMPTDLDFSPPLHCCSEHIFWVAVTFIKLLISHIDVHFHECLIREDVIYCVNLVNVANWKLVVGSPLVVNCSCPCSLHLLLSLGILLSEFGSGSDVDFIRTNVQCLFFANAMAVAPCPKTSSVFCPIWATNVFFYSRRRGSSSAGNGRRISRASLFSRTVVLHAVIIHIFDRYKELVASDQVVLLGVLVCRIRMDIAHLEVCSV